MPKTTYEGPSYEPGKEPPGWAAPEPAPELPPPPPASAPKDEHVAYVAEALGVPEDEAAAMKKAELVELARSAAEGQPETPAAPPSVPPRSDVPPGG